MPKNAEAIAGDIASAPGSARYRRRGPVKRTPVYPHGPGVKWPRLYRKFRRKGWTKEKAARVSNEMYNKIRSGRYKRRKPRPPFPGVGGVYPGGNPTALARGISADMARYGRVHPKTVRAGVGKRDTVAKHGRGTDSPAQRAITGHKPRKKLKIDYFSSDLHFGHDSALKHRYLPGMDQDDHAEELIRRWNEVVKPDDTVALLGDVVLGDRSSGLAVLERLNGTILLWSGNHDHTFAGYGSRITEDKNWPEEYGRYVELLEDGEYEIEGIDIPVSISHFPFRGDHTPEDRYPEFRLPFDESKWIIHGHVHALWRQQDRQINVGIDAWGEPISVRQIAEMIDAGPGDIGLPEEEVGSKLFGFPVVDATASLRDVRRQKLDVYMPESLDRVKSLFDMNGKELYLVGGAVRDTLLGKNPKDYDLVTNATTDEVIEMFQGMDDVTVDLTGAQFAVVRVRVPDPAADGGREEYEIATFRKDIGVGRRPDSVEIATIQEDVARRDLTINALFYDLATGEVVDYVGGIEDLEQQVVRAVGDPSRRFHEDPLRVLRAFRFAGRLGWDLEEETAGAIRANPDLEDVSSERIRDEFLKGLSTSVSRAQYIDLIDRLDTDGNLWGQIFPTLEVDTGAIPATDSNDVYIAALLHKNAPSKVTKILGKIRYQKDEIHNITALIALPDIEPSAVAKLKQEMHRRTTLTSSDIRAFGTAVGMPSGKVEQFIAYFEAPQPLTAKDLMDSGIPEGKEIGRLLNRAELDLFQSLAKGEGGLGRWFKEKWVDISRPLPEGGFAPCGRKDASKGSYPKCVPEAVALKMSQKQIDSAVRRKRRAESTQDREGKKPINVATFTKSKNVPVDAALYARVKAEAKRKFDVYPSAYANGWLVQEYKRRGGRYRVEKARVRTLAGVKRFGQPIGSLIEVDTPKPRIDYRAPKSQQPGGGTRVVRSRPSKRSRDRLAMFERGGMSGSNTPEALARAIIENGGITYNPKRNERRSTGVAVAIDKQHEMKIPIDDFVDRGADYIREYVKRHEKLLAQPRVHLGAWDDDGFIYLDLSVVTSDLDEAADIGRKHDQIGMFHLSTFSDWKRIPVNGVYRYIPVDAPDADIDYLTDLSPAMFTLLETISKASQKRLTSKPVMFVSGADINEDTIPKIHKEICACAGVVKKAYGKKKAPKGYHYMPDGKLMRDDEHVEKNQPGASDVHVDRPIGSNKYKDPKGGLTAAGRRKFKRETGANLKPGVKNYDDASLADKKRWISWASRFYGRSSYPPLKDDKGRPTRFALTAAAWGEPVPSTEQEARKIAAKARARRVDLEKREFSDEERTKLAEEGKAQPDGSYPIVNREDLRNAMRAIGRSKNRALTIRHIKRRAKEMGVSNLPEWIDGNA